MLVQRLRAIQDKYGYLPDAELHALSKETKEPLYRIQELISFFPHFRAEWNKPPYVEVKVCRDMACHLRGAPEMIERLKKLERAGDHGVVVEGVSCLGRCDRAVACSVSRHATRQAHASDEKYIEAKGRDFHDNIYAGHDADEMEALLEVIIAGNATPRPDTDAKHRIDRSDWQIDIYATEEFKNKPYDAVRQYVEKHPLPVKPPDKSLKPEEIAKYTQERQPWLWKIKGSNLKGMGGAGIPAYTKWFDVWNAKPVNNSDDRYVVCNADESEPATFKDRELLLRTPHLVIEGVIMAGLITNAVEGVIYVRHEYGEQITALEAEIKRAELIGACGERIFGSPRRFPVKVFTSPGGYICGEESALIEVMEDRRGQPRNKPPEMQANGLYDMPTVVNNVETLAWAPSILLKDDRWYATAGVRGGEGRRFFSLCGDVTKPGVFEVPSGTTLGELIERAGGIRDGKPLKAIAFSGPSGGLLPARKALPEDFRERIAKSIARAKTPEEGAKFETLMNVIAAPGSTELDLTRLPLDKSLLGMLKAYIGFEVMLGAGLAVYAEPCDPLDHALAHTRFFRNESCGKCVPCRIGTQKLVDIAKNLTDDRRVGNVTRQSLTQVQHDVADIYTALKLTSICGLGRAAGSPLATALTYFEDDLMAGTHHDKTEFMEFDEKSK